MDMLTAMLIGLIVLTATAALSYAGLRMLDMMWSNEEDDYD